MKTSISSSFCFFLKKKHKQHFLPEYALLQAPNKLPKNFSMCRIVALKSHEHSATIPAFLASQSAAPQPTKSEHCKILEISNLPNHSLLPMQVTQKNRTREKDYV